LRFARGAGRLAPGGLRKWWYNFEGRNSRGAGGGSPHLFVWRKAERVDRAVAQSVE
jgi:hypothetical protein